MSRPTGDLACRRGRVRRDRVPRGEPGGQHRGACPRLRGGRPPGRVGLSRRQHRRCDVGLSRRPLRALRQGRRAARRPGEPRPGAARRGGASRRARAWPARTARTRPASRGPSTAARRARTPAGRWRRWPAPSTSGSRSAARTGWGRRAADVARRDPRARRVLAAAAAVTVALAAGVAARLDSALAVSPGGGVTAGSGPRSRCRSWRTAARSPTIGVVGTAWLVGSPPVPPPPALYVDLVHPVVATSERRETVGRPDPRRDSLRPARSRRARPAPPPDVGRPADHARRLARAPRRPRPAVDRQRSPPTCRRRRCAPGRAERPAPSPRHAIHRLRSTRRPSSAAVRTDSRPPPAPFGRRRYRAAPLAAGRHRRDRKSVAGVAAPASPGAIAEAATPGAGAGGIAESRPARDRGSGGARPGSVGAGVGAETAATAPHRRGRPPAGRASTRARLPARARAARAADGAIPPEYESYVRALRQRIQERLVYPWTAVRRGQQGVVELEVRVGPDGRLVAVEVVAGPTRRCVPRGGGGGGAGRGAVPVPAGARGAAARHPPARRVPAALRGP